MVRSRERLGGLLVSTIGKQHEYFDLTGIIYPSLASSARSSGRALRPRAPRFEGGSFDVHNA